ncbi:MAG: hypothetical protein GY804_05050 [Alphaproteobacteria bacterium]|nr:hypothetical protein [Alphaproteobacteria bacterium]
MSYLELEYEIHNTSKGNIVEFLDERHYPLCNAEYNGLFSGSDEAVKEFLKLHCDYKPYNYDSNLDLFKSIDVKMKNHLVKVGVKAEGLRISNYSDLEAAKDALEEILGESLEVHHQIISGSAPSKGDDVETHLFNLNKAITIKRA